MGYTTMSFLSNLFGGPKPAAAAPKKATASDTIQNMKGTQDTLRKNQAVLESKIQTEKQNAIRLQQLMKTNPRKKNEALAAMKKMKMYEQQFNQLDGNILNLEQTIFALEKSIMNEEIIKAQRQANTTLKDQVAQMGDVGDVEDLMADIDENMNEVNEVGDILAQDQFSTNLGIDDDELMEELMGMGERAGGEAADQWAGEALGPVPNHPVRNDPVPSLPTVPIHMPVAPTHEPVQEEDPFADLEASMTI